MTLLKKKKKLIKLSDVPAEVQKAWVMEWCFKNTGIGLGQALYKEYKETVKKISRMVP